MAVEQEVAGIVTEGGADVATAVIEVTGDAAPVERAHDVRTGENRTLVTARLTLSTPVGHLPFEPFIFKSHFSFLLSVMLTMCVWPSEYTVYISLFHFCFLCVIVLFWVLCS